MFNWGIAIPRSVAYVTTSSRTAPHFPRHARGSAAIIESPASGVIYGVTVSGTTMPGRGQLLGVDDLIDVGMDSAAVEKRKRLNASDTKASRLTAARGGAGKINGRTDDDRANDGFSSCTRGS